MSGLAFASSITLPGADALNKGHGPGHNCPTCQAKFARESGAQNTATAPPGQAASGQPQNGQGVGGVQNAQSGQSSPNGDVPKELPHTTTPGVPCAHCQAKQAKHRENVMAHADARASEIKAKLLSRDAKVKDHEQAHQSAAGHLAGGIQLDMASQTINKPDGTSETVDYAAGGSVPITMPSVPDEGRLPPGPEGRAKLEQVQADLQLAFNGATAPGDDMSGADSAIAAKAKSGLGQVGSLLSRQA
jgi:hypothetical protein